MVLFRGSFDQEKEPQEKEQCSLLVFFLGSFNQEIEPRSFVVFFLGSFCYRTHIHHIHIIHIRRTFSSGDTLYPLTIEYHQQMSKP